MSQLKTELKTLIIDSLNLEDFTPDDIGDDTPLFSEEGLGLDSIDGLELGLALKKKYGITLSADKAQVREAFRSVNSLAARIEEFRRENDNKSAGN